MERIYSTTKPFKRANATISSRGLNKADYGAYLDSEEKIDRLILTTLRNGPLHQYEIIKRVGGIRSHIQHHLDALTAQGSISSLALNKRYRVYFLPLDVSKSNS